MKRLFERIKATESFSPPTIQLMTRIEDLCHRKRNRDLLTVKVSVRIIYIYIYLGTLQLYKLSINKL